MGTSLFTKPSSVRQLWKRMGGLLALFGVFLLGATPALAGVGLGVTPTFPSSGKAGMTNIPASLQIQGARTTPNNTPASNASPIKPTPARGAATANQRALCGSPN